MTREQLLDQAVRNAWNDRPSIELVYDSDIKFKLAVEWTAVEKIRREFNRLMQEAG